MPTELEELVGFIASPNPQIRAVAVENLVGYSTAQPSIFKINQLVPVKNLKVLVQDRPQIAQHALTILVNIAADAEILSFLATDENFLDVIFSRITNPSEPGANLLAMLLANLAKWDGLKNIVNRKQKAPEGLPSDDLVLNQLVDLFVKGADGSYNKDANYDYLAYLFADLAKHQEVRQYFVKRQEYDAVIPLTKLKVFTEHKSDIRRKGVASTIKNVAFDVPSHPLFFSEDEIHIFPYILLPIMGSEEYDEDDMMAMLPELSLLPPDKERDHDTSIIQTHVETLMLFTTTRQGRDRMREIKVYPIIRETHLRVKEESVKLACERLVQVLMLDDEVEENGARVVELDDDDDDDDGKVVEV
ncbi:hgh1 protein [Diaporthe amygdali]|uniref:hgh1 protein n=1 Tax=Phomopsis amygdali TaxID=1214568 RepID=UPI0022FEFC80|nr:hgh1 protein [Diaporthe amygdali]KAJ0118090.1 hgh1 protein [Diaporthe amygdali]